MASSSTDFGLVSPTYAWMDNGRDLVVSTIQWTIGFYYYCAQFSKTFFEKVQFYKVAKSGEDEDQK